MNTSRRRNGRQPVAHPCKQTIVVEDLWDWVRFVGENLQNDKSHSEKYGYGY